MALQNIGASNSDDAFYRYKMPRMITKIEGRGNGIKTNVVNMVEIAKALARLPAYTTKYFGCELGAQSKFDEKTGTSLVNGAHDTAKLAGLLENFIKKYVQCYGCGNPETEIVITKTQMLTLKCAACGFVSDVDMRDKLTTFILKNPPEQRKGGKDKKAMRRAEKERLKEGEAADEEMKKLKKEVKKKGTAAAPAKEAPASKSAATGSKKKSEDRSSPTDSQADDDDMDDNDDDNDDVQWLTDTSIEAARQRVQEQLNSVTAEMVMLTTIEEKPKQEKKLLVEEIKELLKDGGAKAKELGTFIKSRSEPPQEVMNALFEALFEGLGKGLAKEIGRKKNYIAAAIEDEDSQMLLLCAIEAFCDKFGGDAMKEVALVVKALYDSDLLEEEFIVRWYEQGSLGVNKSSQIWKSIKPLVQWLQSAESESEEE